MLASTHAFAALCNLEVQTLQVMAIVGKAKQRKKGDRDREERGVSTKGTRAPYRIGVGVSVTHMLSVPAQPLKTLLEVVEAGDDFLGLLIGQCLGE